jgi:hypothetical protein
MDARPTQTFPGRARFLPALSGRSGSAASGDAVARHLILGYRPGWQSVDDLETIAGYIAEMDPSIRTFILPTTHRNLATRKIAATRPTLIVSNGLIPRFRALRGKVYQGWPMPKIEEVRRLQFAGLPVPRTEILTPELKLDPAVWGEFVILKPTDIATSSHGHGVQLMRTARVRYRPPADYPAGHPGRRGPMLVQQYIDTGPNPGTRRVLTLFGEPLYAYALRGTPADRPDLHADDDVIEKAVVATQAYPDLDRNFVREEDCLALARKVELAIPEIPLKGIDLMREAGTGQLYVIEINAGGNTWHFSSGHLAEVRNRLGAAFTEPMHRQFDAFRTAARVLVAKTNAEAA